MKPSDYSPRRERIKQLSPQRSRARRIPGKILPSQGKADVTLIMLTRMKRE